MGNFLKAIEQFFASAWSKLAVYLHSAIPEATAVILNDLLAAADPIVADLQNQNLTGEQKKTQAFSLLEALAVKAAWDVGASLINSAIELAVLKLKATAPTTPVAPAGNLPGGETVTTGAADA